MDTELKQYLDANFARMDERFNAVDERLNAVDERFKEVDIHIEKVETNLLTAFHGWARSMEVQVRGVSGVAMGFDERLSLTEERVSHLERKLSS